MKEKELNSSEDYAKFFVIKGFDVSQVDVSTDYPGTDSVGIQGISESGSFFLVFTKGCTPAGRNDEFEPTTLYLDNLDVSDNLQGQGIGTHAMRALVEAARHHGFSAIRSNYINPAMVSITEKLASDGLIQKPVYEAHFSEEFVVEPTTGFMLDHPDLFDSSEQAKKASAMAPDGGSVCAFAV